MEFQNSYSDVVRAQAYAMLEFPNTYYLAYRDLPSIIKKYAKGNTAMDFGCGTGRSTRFLKGLGYDAFGVDISAEMVSIAKNSNPEGNYYVIEDGNFNRFEKGSLDLILSVFTFDNIPDVEHRVRLLKGLKSLLKPGAVAVLLDTNPELYTNEWASFSTIDFPENKYAKSGDKVKVIMTDVPDRRPVEDIIWQNEDYMLAFTLSGFELVDKIMPLGKMDEPYLWVNETMIPPWVIYVLI